MDICSFLTEHGISYERFDHPAVFTCEESEKLCPVMPGTGTKNLFLRDEKGKQRFLVVVGHGKNVDLKALKVLLGVQKLSFGSPKLLKQYLGVDPGAVTLLGIIHDSDHQIEVIIDAPVWAADKIGCHPLVNTTTLVIPHAGVERFLKATGHTPRVMEVPQR